MYKGKDTAETEGTGQPSQAPEQPALVHSPLAHDLPLMDNNLEQTSESSQDRRVVNQETSSHHGPHGPISSLEPPGIDRGDITGLMKDEMLRTTRPWEVVSGGQMIVVFESLKLVITNDSEDTMMQVQITQTLENPIFMGTSPPPLNHPPNIGDANVSHDSQLTLLPLNSIGRDFVTDILKHCLECPQTVDQIPSQTGDGVLQLVVYDEDWQAKQMPDVPFSWELLRRSDGERRGQQPAAPGGVARAPADNAGQLLARFCRVFGRLLTFG